MERYRVDFGTLAWKGGAPGLRFQSHQEDGRQMRVVLMEKKFLEGEWCTKGHWGYVLEGEIEINFSGLMVTFRQGDGIVIPPGDEHKHMPRALTDRAKLLLFEEV
jgi:quercetin dioxygenase-like cupin family protein